MKEEVVQIFTMKVEVNIEGSNAEKMLKIGGEGEALLGGQRK